VPGLTHEREIWVSEPSGQDLKLQIAAKLLENY